MMIAQWKKFTGSDEQVSEILNAKDGFKFKDSALWESVVIEPAWPIDGDIQLKTYLNSRECVEYFICQPHPHAEMIIEWARTGREVYVFDPVTEEWLPDEWPDWSTELKYSFNPDGDGK